jgi:murein tripeptide amidase MpaA
MTNSQKTFKNGVLVTGGHHARELTSYTMNLYMMLKTAYGYYNRDKETMEMLNSTVLFFVPIVNVDGFKYISDVFANTGKLRYIRKNRNDGRRDGY